jgi:hypothetical protein
VQQPLRQLLERSRLRAVPRVHPDVQVVTSGTEEDTTKERSEPAESTVHVRAYRVRPRAIP